MDGYGLFFLRNVKLNMIYGLSFLDFILDLDCIKIGYNKYIFELFRF